MKAFGPNFAVALFAAYLISGSAIAQVDSQVRGSVTWDTDTGKVSGRVGAEVTQTRGGTTTGAGVDYDGSKVTGTIIVEDKKPQEQPKR